MYEKKIIYEGASLPLQRSPNTDYTLSLLNYLQAGLNGRYVYSKTLNVLGVTEHAQESTDAAKTDFLEKLTTDIHSVQGWLTLLLEEDKPLFDLEWTSAKTPESQSAFSLCDYLLQDLETHSLIVEAILQQKDFNNISRPNLAVILGSAMRFYSAREIYLNTFKIYYEKLGDKQQLKVYKDERRACKKNGEYCRKLIAAFQAPRELSIEYYQALYAEAIVLPGIYRLQKHDLTMLRKIYDHIFTYQDAGASEEEGLLWQKLQISPQEAGHWIAYGISPQEAHAWISLNIPDHHIAGVWRAWGYPPQDASIWILENFATPQEATPWANLGYDPTEARQLVDRGVSDPSKIHS